MPLAMRGLKRLQAELAELSKPDAPEGVSAEPKGEATPQEWTARVAGPPGSPYEGGTFTIDITFPDDYPFKPPKVSFNTKIYQ